MQNSAGQQARTREDVHALVRDIAKNPAKYPGKKATVTAARRMFGLDKAAFRALPTGKKAATEAAPKAAAPKAAGAKNTGTKTNPFQGTVNKVTAQARAKAAADLTGKTAHYRVGKNVIAYLPTGCTNARKAK